jgi:hypothetical protein
VFPFGVGAITVDAETVEGGHAERGGEIAVAAAAGHDGVGQHETDVARDRLRLVQQSFDRRSLLERRAVHAARDVELHVGIERFKPNSRSAAAITHAKVDTDHDAPAYLWLHCAVALGIIPLTPRHVLIECYNLASRSGRRVHGWTNPFKSSPKIDSSI